MNMQDPVDHTLSEESRKKLSKSIKKGLAEGKYKTKYDYCNIEVYDYFGEYLETATREVIAKKYNVSIKDIINCAGGYKKGKSKNGLRFRYSASNVQVQKFNPNLNSLGNSFVFFYIDKDGNEKYAFSTVKNC